MYPSNENPDRNQNYYDLSYTSTEPRRELNMQQVNWLVERLRPEDRNRIENAMRSCAREKFWTISLPFTVLSTGSMYWLQTRMPPKYHWPIAKQYPYVFYPTVIVMSIMTGNIVGMTSCTGRAKPLLDEMYPKVVL